MGMVKCKKCGEIHREYDQFCPRCGTINDVSARETDCDGKCEGCAYDMLHGCAKPHREATLLESSPYPHFVYTDKSGKSHLVDESERRNRAGTVAMAIMPTGAFGIHDFYARRYWQGLIHLALFIISCCGCIWSVGGVTKWCFVGSWVYAVVEGVLILVRVITDDGKGYPFA